MLWFDWLLIVIFVFLFAGEGVFDDESMVVSCTASGLRIHGSTVYLERGAKPPPDTVTLNIVRVINNSTAFKYEASQSGDRIQEMELVVQLKDTVTSLRDKLGVLICGFKENWTADKAITATPVTPTAALTVQDVSSVGNGDNDGEGAIDVFKGLRLRRTCWLKDFADLLLETTDKGSLLTVGESGLHNGDTLLLENGCLPIRGQITLQVGLILL